MKRRGVGKREEEEEEEGGKSRTEANQSRRGYL
jgi:hypothetical protein